MIIKGVEAGSAACGTPFATENPMRIAIPLWQGRISPVFDEASRIVLVDIFGNREQCRREESLAVRNPFERARMLPVLGVEIIICGMISQIQQTALTAVGIRIIPHICGAMDEVIAAFLDGSIENGALRMPGCSHVRICKRRLRLAAGGDE